MGVADQGVEDGLERRDQELGLGGPRLEVARQGAEEADGSDLVGERVEGLGDKSTPTQLGRIGESTQDVDDQRWWEFLHVASCESERERDRERRIWL